MDLLETLLDACANLVFSHLRMTAERKGDVLENAHRVKQRPFLKCHAEVASKFVQLASLQAAEIAAEHIHVAAVGLHQADDVLERDALALP